MQQKPYNLDRAIGLLKEESPKAEFEPRLRQGIHRKPSRSLRLVKVVPIGVASVALAIAFWPRTESNGAWAQTVERSLSAKFIYRETRFPNGELLMQDWQSGKKRSMVLYRRDGSVGHEWRSDGLKTVEYFDFWTHRFYANGVPARPVHHANWTRFALSSKYVEVSTEQGALETQSMDSLLGQKGTVLLSHIEPKGPNKFERYRIRFEKLGRLTLDFEVEPSTRLVRTISVPGRNTIQRVSYPDIIPDTVFEPRVQKVSGIPVFDESFLSNEARNRVLAGYGRIGSVTLRLVAMDSDGALHVFWTGAPQGDQKDRKITIPGTPCLDQIYYGTPHPVKNDAKKPKKTLSEGQELLRTVRVPKVKVCETINVTIPYPGGKAEYRNIPILRIGFFSSIETTLRDIEIPK